MNQLKSFSARIVTVLHLSPTNWHSVWHIYILTFYFDTLSIYIYMLDIREGDGRERYIDPDILFGHSVCSLTLYLTILFWHTVYILAFYTFFFVALRQFDFLFSILFGIYFDFLSDVYFDIRSDAKHFIWRRLLHFIWHVIWDYDFTCMLMLHAYLRWKTTHYMLFFCEKRGEHLQIVEAFQRIRDRWGSSLYRDARAPLRPDGTRRASHVIAPVMAIERCLPCPSRIEHRCSDCLNWSLGFATPEVTCCWWHFGAWGACSRNIKAIKGTFGHQ